MIEVVVLAHHCVAGVLSLNVERLPFRAGSVDCIVVDLPFGHKHGSALTILDLYPASFAEFERVLRMVKDS